MVPQSLFVITDLSTFDTQWPVPVTMFVDPTLRVEKPVVIKFHLANIKVIFQKVMFSQPFHSPLPKLVQDHAKNSAFLVLKLWSSASLLSPPHSCIALDESPACASSALPPPRKSPGTHSTRQLHLIQALLICWNFSARVKSTTTNLILLIGMRWYARVLVTQDIWTYFYNLSSVGTLLANEDA